MSTSRALRHGLPLLLLAAVVLALPHAAAGWTEAYGELDELGLTFRGLACKPTLMDLSGPASPRADILGVENLHEGTFLVGESVENYTFNGADNQHTDPRHVEGSPYRLGLPGLGTAGHDDERFVSLGEAGWFLGKMDGVVQDGEGEDLAVYEVEGTLGGIGEPFCVFGSPSKEGPYSFIGIHDPKKDNDGVPGRVFDLSDYARFSGTSLVQYVMVLDSDEVEPFIDVSFSGPESIDSLEEATFTDETDLTGFKDILRTWSASVGSTVVWEEETSLGSVVHAFPYPAQHKVCLHVEATVTFDGEARRATGASCQAVDVLNRNPEAALEATPQSPAIGQPVELNASASFDPEGRLVERYEWDLGDGTQKTTTTPLLMHRYDAKGIYDVAVTVRDEHGGEDTAALGVATENDPPEAVFQVLDYRGDLLTEGTQLNDIIFDASASSDPDGDRLTYVWDFGDGTGEVEGAGPEHRVVRHAFAELGEYEVTLTVHDGFLGEDVVTETVHILYEPPVADFSGPTSILSLENATFTDTSEAGEDHPLVDALRTWTVGEGAPVVGGPEALTYAFQRPGQYVVSLRVEDTNGGYGSAEQTVTVQNRPPTVDSSELDLPPATRIPATFRVVASDLDGEVVSWLWDFGDGTTSSDPQPRHAYAGTGSYPLSLTVTDDLGATTTWRPPQGVLEIDNEAPTAQMTVFGDPDAPQTVRFQDASTDDGRIVSWAWYFGDGAGNQTAPDASEAEASHAFPDADETYRVRLVVTDDEGASWSLVRYIRPGELATGGDADGDGVPDGADNCPAVPNPDQADADGDGVGDACVDLAAAPDGDDDGDGVPNALDAFPFDASEHRDTDGDGVGDNADPDADGDGISDAEESVLGTDPLSADTDGDGVTDAQELAAGTDPTAAPVEPPPEPAQDVARPEGRGLAWVWVLLGVFGAAGAAAGGGYWWLRRRGGPVAWRTPEF